MTDQEIQTLIASSSLAWINLHNLVNEDQRPLEFRDHRFMIQIYADQADDIVCIKSAQVGFSVFAILSSLHELKYEQRNILYVLPNRNVVDGFVVPKVNPLITSNPIIARDVGADSVGLKQLGKRFMYFRGGFTETAALNISVDTLIIDEFDRMPDMKIVNMFDSRLQAARHPRRKRFSNPSGVGFGVDALYQDSNQYHWFITCHDCGHKWFLDFAAGEDQRHYIDQELGQFVCGACGAVLTDADRRNGEWVAKYPKRARHGYWISQMMAPWVSAARILQQHDDMDPATFNSMVLGKAYTPSDMVVNRETILRACAPSRIPQTDVAMGVDQKASELHWVAMTSQGIFAHGRTDGWDEIERMKLTWNATVVADGRPYVTQPKMLADKYRDFFVGFGQSLSGLDTVVWKDKTVAYDRVKILDIVANEISGGKLLFHERPNELEDYIADWANIYRTTVEQPDGRIKSDWLKKDNRESDYPFATAYARIALSRLLVSGDMSQLHELRPTGNATDTVLPDGRLESTLGEAVGRTFDNMD